MAQLTADTNSIDHLGESWAKPLPVLPLARGSVSGQITGLQGRFNVNWLADPEHIIAHQAFDRLLTRLAIPARTGAAIRSFLRPGGPENQGPWIRLDPPLDPVGGHSQSGAAAGHSTAFGSLISAVVSVFGGPARGQRPQCEHCIQRGAGSFPATFAPRRSHSSAVHPATTAL
ncbi:hypothetical protein EBB79_21775 (plasmid) [Parasedimentitalea marina]|uniref:Uncharacterized protein n=1 Tax=Parasedimentitalea marina TaxID=2483033 RepID=A0A3T0N9D8_9RHOB|nr:hypothetical protein EBB79_21775 [Parasedimentitalea marina]